MGVGMFRRHREQPEEGVPADLEERTVAQLRALARERGVSLGGATVKADIVAAIRGALEPAGSDGEQTGDGEQTLAE